MIAMKSAPRSKAWRIAALFPKLATLMISRFQPRASVAASKAGLNAAQVISQAIHATVLPDSGGELTGSVTVIWLGVIECRSTTACARASPAAIGLMSVVGSAWEVGSLMISCPSSTAALSLLGELRESLLSSLHAEVTVTNKRSVARSHTGLLFIYASLDTRLCSVVKVSDYGTRGKYAYSNQ